MTPAEFARKWLGSTRNERAASQEHFIDLCVMLGVPTPGTDPTGDWYAFEKGASRTSGGEGWADVWKKATFGWEYKGKKANLAAAYKQLLDYREALENPPLLVVCDLNRFEIRTNFTSTATKVHTFTLDDLARDPEEPLRLLRAVMSDPEELRPREEATQLTKDAAAKFADLAGSLDAQHDDPLRVAHFLDKLLFCLYAEDATVLPKGLFSRLVESGKTNPAEFTERLHDLFERMSVGGYFGVDKVDWFNGGLFADADALPLTRDEIEMLAEVGQLDWSLIEPAIFGTLFERGLDPNKRTQLGAHYTDRAAIERLVEPVVMTPLRREFDESVAEIEALLAKGPRNRRKALAIHQAYLARLRAVRVLDPACGSGNFLYIALRKLKDLEREAILWGSERLRITMEVPRVGPEAVLGIEINPYAAELARVTIWIGEIQWMISHGFGYDRTPVLRPLDQITTADALLDMSDPANPQEREWPEAEFIVGNPPFLGNRRMRRSLGSDYTQTLFDMYGDRLANASDLVCYWHEKARAMVASGKTKRVGLLATQGIRGGASRRVIDRIKESGDLFLAWSDEPWVLEGANVRISFLGYDDGSQKSKQLNGVTVPAINADLTVGIDLTRARRLTENQGIAFYADIKGGPFDINADQAAQMLAAPNPDGRANADVVRPWINGLDVTRRPRNMSIIDFGVDTSLEEAALYEEPIEFVRWVVKPVRDKVRRATYREHWWLHSEPGSGMRAALAGLSRYFVTPMTAKHRLFSWVTPETLSDHAVIVFARDDDVSFGILHSRAHRLWSLRLGTQLESRPRYTPTTSFETFPFPRPNPEQSAEIGEAARRLVILRNGWLNPVGVEDDMLLTRTMTELYNAPPLWLEQAHERLDAAVLAAYGLPTQTTDDELLGHLLDLNLARTAGTNASVADEAGEDDSAGLGTQAIGDAL
ncbi:MAG: class I SAM-dependent DNA methyltransferase [Chloroflexi bacterium]|nr:class I SAM-dependent DNA methyltransferase [Chloroflexota bacterium]